MLQQEEPDDFVLATGKTTSVRKFVELAFNHIGIEIGWMGSGINEVGYDSATGKPLVNVDENILTIEVDILQGDASKAKSLDGKRQSPWNNLLLKWSTPL